MPLRIATWNLERSGTRHRSRVLPQRAHLQSLNADVYVLTECHDRFEIEGCGAPVTSAPGQSPYEEADRAVGIWSRWPILRSLQTEDRRLTACAEIDHPSGPLLVYGTVLPYHADGGPAVGRWQSHREALALQLSEWRQLRAAYPDHLMCVAGDFNMNLDGRKWYGDPPSRQKLLAGLAEVGLRCVTTDDWFDAVGRSSIDHICISPNLVETSGASAWPGTVAGRRLSDHNGVVVDLVAIAESETSPLHELLGQFHRLIRSRVSDLAPSVTRLPPMPTRRELSETTANEQGWLPIPGMHGGFAYWLINPETPIACLCVSSWSRLITGSTQTHEISASGTRLVHEEDDSPEPLPAS